LKGQISSKRIVLKELGGVVGDHGTLFYGVPTFAVGEEVLVYLDTREDGSLRVHQMFLGKFSITPDPESGQLRVVRQNADSHVQMITSPSWQSGVEQGAVTNPMAHARD